MKNWLIKNYIEARFGKSASIEQCSVGRNVINNAISLFIRRLELAIHLVIMTFAIHFYFSEDFNKATFWAVYEIALIVFLTNLKRLTKG